ncbi:MAG: GIY-YIG nuclease family protein [Bacteroidota bacterium]
MVWNVRRTTLYIGVTSNLHHRIYQHKHEYGSKFTHQYNCNDLVYCLEFDRIEM